VRGNPRHKRLPLVFATFRATELAAEALPPGTVIENEVTRAIAGDRMSAPDADGVVTVFGDGFTAKVVRAVSPSTGRKAWNVISVIGVARYPDNAGVTRRGRP
jgi:hypothetical protein